MAFSQEMKEFLGGFTATTSAASNIAQAGYYYERRKNEQKKHDDNTAPGTKIKEPPPGNAMVVPAGASGSASAIPAPAPLPMPDPPPAMPVAPPVQPAPVTRYTSGGTVRQYQTGGRMIDESGGRPPTEEEVLLAQAVEPPSGSDPYGPVSPSGPSVALPPFVPPGQTPEVPYPPKPITPTPPRPRPPAAAAPPAIETPPPPPPPAPPAPPAQPPDTRAGTPKTYNPNTYANGVRRNEPSEGDSPSVARDWLGEALNGALTFAQTTFGLDGKGAALPGTDPQQAQGQKAVMAGVGAATPDAIQAAHRAVNTGIPNKALHDIRVLEESYRYFVMRGNTAKANSIAYEIAAYSRGVAAQYGQQAAEALRAGNLQDGYKWTAHALNAVPDGRTVNVNGNTVTYRDEKTGQQVAQFQFGPQEALNMALGLADGSRYWDILMHRAAEHQQAQKGGKRETEADLELKRARADAARAQAERARRGPSGGGGRGGGRPPSEAQEDERRARAEWLRAQTQDRQDQIRRRDEVDPAEQRIIDRNKKKGGTGTTGNPPNGPGPGASAAPNSDPNVVIAEAQREEEAEAQVAEANARADAAIADADERVAYAEYETAMGSDDDYTPDEPTTSTTVAAAPADDDDYAEQLMERRLAQRTVVPDMRTPEVPVQTTYGNTLSGSSGSNTLTGSAGDDQFENISNVQVAEAQSPLRLRPRRPEVTIGQPEVVAPTAPAATTGPTGPGPRVGATPQAIPTTQEPPPAPVVTEPTPPPVPTAPAPEPPATPVPTGVSDATTADTTGGSIGVTGPTALPATLNPRITPPPAPMRETPISPIGEDDAPKFDPEGADYDINRARELRFQRDDKGHLPSRDPTTGRILKGKQHPTFQEAIEQDKKSGHYVIEQPDGVYTINPDTGPGTVYFKEGGGYVPEEEVMRRYQPKPFTEPSPEDRDIVEDLTDAKLIKDPAKRKRLVGAYETQLQQNNRDVLSWKQRMVTHERNEQRNAAIMTAELARKQQEEFRQIKESRVAPGARDNLDADVDKAVKDAKALIANNATLGTGGSYNTVFSIDPSTAKEDETDAEGNVVRGKPAEYIVPEAKVRGMVRSLMLTNPDPTAFDALKILDELTRYDDDPRNPTWRSYRNVGKDVNGNTLLRIVGTREEQLRRKASGVPDQVIHISPETFKEVSGLVRRFQDIDKWKLEKAAADKEAAGKPSDLDKITGAIGDFFGHGARMAKPALPPDAPVRVGPRPPGAPSTPMPLELFPPPQQAIPSTR